MAKSADEKKKPTYKYDVFEVLNRLNSKDANYYSTLDETTQKAIQPFILQRWMTGTSEARQIIFINELVNPFVFALTQHKQLLLHLLSVCTKGRPQRYKWIAAPKKGSSHSESVKVLQQIYNYSASQALDSLKCLTPDQVLDYAEQLGYQKEQLAKIRKEWNAATET